MIKTKSLLILMGLCIVTIGLVVFGLNTVSKTGSLLPLSLTQKKGTLYFVGPTRGLIHQPFSLKVMIDTNNQNLNVAGFYLRFDPEKVMVDDIGTVNSFCQFYPEKRIDNRLGLVSLACGAPHPGVKGKNQLIELSITPLATGNTVLRVTKDSKLLLSDGKGTNILDDYPIWEVQIAPGL